MALQLNYKLKIVYTNIYPDYITNLKEKFLNENITDVMYKEITVENVYAKVINLNGSKDGINFNLGIFEDETKTYLIATDKFNFVPDINNDAVRWDKQAYEYLKTLPEFVDAIDC